MQPERRRRHPLLRAIAFAVAAVYSFSLGIYGAVAIPISRDAGSDYPPRGLALIEVPTPNYHTELRILCLVAGLAAALLLARAANRTRFRRERLGLRAF